MPSRDARERWFHRLTAAFSCVLVYLATSSLSGAVPAGEGATAIGLAMAVNDALTQYIDIHNSLFEVTPSRLIPIPGVFEAIDFKAYTKNLDDINADLLKAKMQIASLQKTGVSMPEAKEFVRVLDEYVRALMSTISALRKVSFELYKKSHDTASYSSKAYQRDMRIYEASIDKYVSIAQKLNPLYTKLDDALHRVK